MSRVDNFIFLDKPDDGEVVTVKELRQLAEYLDSKKPSVSIFFPEKYGLANIHINFIPVKGMIIWLKDYSFPFNDNVEESRQYNKHAICWKVKAVHSSCAYYSSVKDDIQQYSHHSVEVMVGKDWVYEIRSLMRRIFLYKPKRFFRKIKNFFKKG
jgi:hypothetical protein